MTVHWMSDNSSRLAIFIMYMTFEKSTRCFEMASQYCKVKPFQVSLVKPVVYLSLNYNQIVAASMDQNRTLMAGQYSMST